MRLCTSGGVRSHVEVPSDSGSPPGERPVLLALHGGPGLDHTVLRPGVDALRDDVKVVRIDQRGHRRTDGAIRDRPDEFARIVREWVAS